MKSFLIVPPRCGVLNFSVRVGDPSPGYWSIYSYLIFASYCEGGDVTLRRRLIKIPLFEQEFLLPLLLPRRRLGLDSQ
jgi:hypothetical protein